MRPASGEPRDRVDLAGLLLDRGEIPDTVAHPEEALQREPDSAALRPALADARHYEDPYAAR